MKKLILLSSTIFLCTSMGLASLAQPHEGAYTRDEVRAELAQARASGEMANSEDSSRFINQYDSTGPAMTRHQVRDELEIAKMDGSFDRMNRDDSMTYLNAEQGRSGKTRAEVRAEFDQARRSGELAAMNSEDSSRMAHREIMAE